jgi:hypothetical protein
MTVVEESIDITGPIASVFATVTDPRRAPEWNPSVVEVDNFSGYPIQPGTTWEQVVMVLGKPMRLLCRVTEYAAPHSGVIEVSGAQRGRIWTRCQALGDVTRVTQGMDFIPPGGMLGRLGVSVMKGRIQQELYKTMIRQRDALEIGRGNDGSGTDR